MPTFVTDHELVEYLISRGVKVNGSYLNSPHDHGRDIEDDGDYADKPRRCFEAKPIIITHYRHCRIERKVTNMVVHRPDTDLVRKCRMHCESLRKLVTEKLAPNEKSWGMEAW